MSVLSWNCRGLGQPRTIQVLLDLARCKKPSIIFLMETLCSKSKLESNKLNLGFDGQFVVDRVGRSGGLALFWHSSATVSLLNYARNFIDVHVEVAGLGDWRLTEFYGYHESCRRRQSWDLPRWLSSSSSSPWVCLGDFNDLLEASEKKGRIDHPNWKLQGFKSAISYSGLIDVGMDGYPFTWERF